MSYIISVKRTIELAEVTGLVAADSSLCIVRQDSDTLDIAWSHGSNDGFFQLVHGELQVISPSTAAAEKLTEVARLLGAELVGEEDLMPQNRDALRLGIFAGRSTWIGWPVLVLMLVALLVWRW